MNPRAIAAVLVMIVSATTFADDFFLKHEQSGKMYGPFQTDSGSKVVLGKTTFTVVRKELSPLEERMSKIVIPEVDFRQAALEDVADFLSRASRDFDPQKRGVNVSLLKKKQKPKQPAKKTDDIFESFGDAAGFQGFNSSSFITLSMKEATLLELIKLVTEKAGYAYKTSDTTVTLYPAPETP